MSTEQDVASPAAAVLERRQRRTTPQKRKQVCSDSDSEEFETGSDGEWSGNDDPLSDHGREDEDEDEPVLRGRVRRARDYAGRYRPGGRRRAAKNIWDEIISRSSSWLFWRRRSGTRWRCSSPRRT